jgi:hypothetical protein
MCAEKYLKEFENSSELLKLSKQVLKDLKTMYTQLHEEWSRDLQVCIINHNQTVIRMGFEVTVLPYTPATHSSTEVGREERRQR